MAAFTERKLVFDASPRRYSLDRLRAELREAGFPVLVTRPFLVPQHVRLPALAASLLAAVEPTRLGRFVLRYRFTLMTAAFCEPPR